MRWFGKSWGAPVNELPKGPVPVDQPCQRCGVAIEANDRGVTLPRFDELTVENAHYHIDCFIRSVVPEAQVPPRKS